MRRFLKNMLLFSLFGAVCYPFLLLAWGQISLPVNDNLSYCRGCTGHSYTRLREALEKGPADLLILGSSHAYRSFDTRIFRSHGIDAFNLGSTAQTPIQSQMLLSHFLPRMQPRLVVLEVYPVVFTIDGLESFVDIASNRVAGMPLFSQMLRLRHITAFNTWLMQAMMSVFYREKSSVEPLRHGPDRYVSGGFVERDMGYFDGSELPHYELDMRPDQLEALEATLDTLRAHDTEVVLCFAPVTRALYEDLGDLSAFDSLMSSYGDYYNFNELMELDDSLHFFDADHLNQRGVDLFNDALMRQLEKKFSCIDDLIPAHSIYL